MGLGDELKAAKFFSWLFKSNRFVIDFMNRIYLIKLEIKIFSQFLQPLLHVTKPLNEHRHDSNKRWAYRTLVVGTCANLNPYEWNGVLRIAVETRKELNSILSITSAEFENQNSQTGTTVTKIVEKSDTVKTKIPTAIRNYVEIINRSTSLSRSW